MARIAAAPRDLEVACTAELEAVTLLCVPELLRHPRIAHTINSLSELFGLADKPRRLGTSDLCRMMADAEYLEDARNSRVGHGFSADREQPALVPDLRHEMGEPQGVPVDAKSLERWRPDGRDKPPLRSAQIA